MCVHDLQNTDDSCPKTLHLESEVILYGRCFATTAENLPVFLNSLLVRDRMIFGFVAASEL